MMQLEGQVFQSLKLFNASPYPPVLDTIHSLFSAYLKFPPKMQMAPFTYTPLDLTWSGLRLLRLKAAGITTLKHKRSLTPKGPKIECELIEAFSMPTSSPTTKPSHIHGAPQTIPVRYT